MSNVIRRLPRYPGCRRVFRPSDHAVLVISEGDFREGRHVDLSECETQEELDARVSALKKGLVDSPAPDGEGSELGGVTAPPSADAGEGGAKKGRAGRPKLEA